MDESRKKFEEYVAKKLRLPFEMITEARNGDRYFAFSSMDAGHYRTTAAAPQLRFDERNIHKQCVVCNQHKSGNLVPYRVELISRIGQEAVDEIESNHNRHRWTIEECKAIKAEYQQKLKDLRNSRSEAA